MRRTGATLAALAAVVAGAAGCSDPHAGSLPPVSSPSPTPATTTSSPRQDVNTELRQALERYFDALYAAGLDPAHRTDDLARLMSPACACRQTLDVLREEARQRRSIDYRYTLRDVTVVSAGEIGGDIKYTVAQSAGAERDRAGRVITRFPATVERFTAHFVVVDGRWLLDKVTQFK